MAMSDQEIFDEEEMRQKIEREVRIEMMEAQLGLKSQVQGSSSSYNSSSYSSNYGSTGSPSQSQFNNNNNNSQFNNSNNQSYQNNQSVTRESPSNSFSVAAASYAASNQDEISVSTSSSYPSSYPSSYSSSLRDVALSTGGGSFSQNLDFFQQLEQQKKLEEQVQLQQLQRQQQELEQQIRQNEYAQLQSQQAQQLEMDEEIRSAQRELEAEMLKTGRLR